MTETTRTSTPPAAVTRIQLLDWLLPGCQPDRAAILYPKGEKGLSPGWINTTEDFSRAVEAYRNGRLNEESFESVTKNGAPYEITNGEWLGLVPHRNGQVSVFWVDLDDHTDDGGNVHLLASIGRLFAAVPVVFTSKSGKGMHAFFSLAESMETAAFVQWVKAWGFNREGEPEVFPKTAKNTQGWLPNEPNGDGGDRYLSGSFESCVVEALPAPPTAQLTTTTLNFVRGFVRQPGRNDALNKAAFELGKKRVGRREADRLCKLGARLCGLEEEEPDATRATIASGYEAGIGAAPPVDISVNGHLLEPRPRFFKLDGIGNGERLIHNFGDLIRYCFALDAWLFWNGRYWSFDAQATVEAMAKKTGRHIRKEMKRALEGAQDAGKPDSDVDDIEKAYRRQYLSASRASGVRDTLKMAQSEPGVKVDVEALDANPMLLNVRNGTIDLATGALRDHRRGDAITKMAPASFDPQANCTLWEGFLDRVFDGDEELIAFIQRGVGYSLTGQVSEQCLFFLHGAGQNGKSVFIQTILGVLGDYAQKAPTEMIMRQERSSSGAASPDMERLRGVRFAVTAELDDGQRLGEARVKDLTGSDRIVARKLYCNPVEFDPTHKLWVYGNHKPVIRGTDEGIWRRLRLVPFTVKIPDDEKDPELFEKLLVERDGILGWAVRGCLEWQRDGLGLPGAVASATEAYRNESDRLGAFLEECCVVEEGARVGKGELYSAYKTWAEQAGERPMRMRKLGQQMVESGFTEDRDNRKRFWVGVRLPEEGLFDE